MKKQQLVIFLLEANRAGYADENAKVADMPDGGHEIVYRSGDLQFRDNWYGGDPFAGQECITVGEKAVWAMQYRGWVGEGFGERADEVFGFLKTALSKCSEEEPVRGPAEFSDGLWRYKNEWSHDIANFSGKETIWFDGKISHVCNYFGGLVDGAVLED